MHWSKDTKPLYTCMVVVLEEREFLVYILFCKLEANPQVAAHYNLISSAIVSEVKTIGTPLGTSRWCLLTLLTCQTQQTIHCILKIKIDFVRELIFQMDF